MGAPRCPPKPVFGNPRQQLMRWVPFVSHLLFCSHCSMPVAEVYQFGIPCRLSSRHWRVIHVVATGLGVRVLGWVVAMAGGRVLLRGFRVSGGFPVEKV